jgi:hypothetical protein
MDDRLHRSAIDGIRGYRYDVVGIGANGNLNVLGCLRPLDRPIQFWKPQAIVGGFYRKWLGGRSPECVRRRGDKGQGKGPQEELWAFLREVGIDPRLLAARVIEESLASNMLFYGAETRVTNVIDMLWCCFPFCFRRPT